MKFYTIINQKIKKKNKKRSMKKKYLGGNISSLDNSKNVDSITEEQKIAYEKSIEKYTDARKKVFLEE